MKIPSTLRALLTTRNFFLTGVAIVLAFNLIELIPDTLSLQKKKKLTPFYFQGFKFAGLDDVLKDVEYVGYYTDKDMTGKSPLATLNQAQFSQAQYVLAPVILDLNNTNYPLVLFDCSSTEKAMAKIREIGAVPIKRNQFGIILAQRIP